MKRKKEDKKGERTRVKKKERGRGRKRTIGEEDEVG